MTSIMTMRTAGEIVHHLHANGFTTKDAAGRQVLNLVEEAGEFVGAYRRCTGMARRRGTVEEVRAELADVVITTYVTAAELGIELDPDVSARLGACPPDVDVVSAVLDVAVAANAIIWPYQQRRRSAYPPVLGEVIRAARWAALALGFDLAAAVTAKLDVIFARGWREPAVSGVDDPPHTVLCGFDCGVLATSEPELDAHEANCDHAPTGDAVPFTAPTPRPVRSLPRRRAGGQS